MTVCSYQSNQKNYFYIYCYMYNVIILHPYKAYMKQAFVLIFFVLSLAACHTSKPVAAEELRTLKKNTPDRDGSSFSKAIIIEEFSETTGVKAEYAWLDKHYAGYKTEKQTLRALNNIPCDIIRIKTPDGQEKDVYFDISNYYGKY